MPEHFSIELTDEIFDAIYTALTDSSDASLSALKQDHQLTAEEIEALRSEVGTYEQLLRELVTQAPEHAKKRNLI